MCFKHSPGADFEGGSFQRDKNVARAATRAAELADRATDAAWQPEEAISSMRASGMLLADEQPTLTLVQQRKEAAAVDEEAVLLTPRGPSNPVRAMLDDAACPSHVEGCVALDIDRDGKVGPEDLKLFYGRA